MPLKRIKPMYRKMKFPVRLWQDLKNHQWYIVDKEDVIVAEMYTKQDAETVNDSLNYIGKAIGMLVDMLAVEDAATLNPTAPVERVYERVQTIREVYEFLVDLGIMKELEPDHSIGFKQWTTSLQIGSKENSREEPEWTKLYHVLKNEGHFNETD